MASNVSSFKWVHGKFDRDIQQTIARLATFRASIGRRILKKAANKASQVHLKALKSVTPSKKSKDWGSGLWRKSLGRKVTVYASRQGSAVVWWAVGPRSKVEAVVPRKYKWFRYKGPHDKPAPGKYELKRRKYKENKRGFVAGKLYRIPITAKTPAKFATMKVWPVKYSHLLERKRGYIAKANAQAQSAVKATITDTLTEAMMSV